MSPALHDVVRTDDGREGAVIGFYRLESETVLVLYPSGETAELATDAVHIVATAASLLLPQLRRYRTDVIADFSA